MQLRKADQIYVKGPSKEIAMYAPNRKESTTPVDEKI